jgi:serine/threonine-protein kinase
MSEDRETRAPKPGDVLAGKYEVERVLGEGGMGVVVAARHRQLDQKVALKFMHPGVAKDAIQRFMKEAKAVAKLRSENVARVMDVGTLEDRSPYIVMEYLDGEDLNAVAKSGAIPLADAIDYVMQAGVALAEAHAAGIVHRDVKPGNLFLTRRPDGSPLVKVLDFGISKMQSTDPDVDGSTTRTGTVMGSPSYMSPEQVRSSKFADARSDIWSLGVVLFYLTTGGLPFEAETVPDMFVAILHHPPRSATSVNPALPAALDPVLERCFHKAAEDRYQNLAELAQALQPFAFDSTRPLIQAIDRLVGGSVGRPPLRSLTAIDGVQPLANQDTEAALSVSQPPSNLAKRWPLFVALAAVLVLGLAGVALFLQKTRAPVAAVPAESASVALNADAPLRMLEEPKPTVAPSAAMPETSSAPVKTPAEQTGAKAKPAKTTKPSAPQKPPTKPEEGVFETVQ